MRIADPRPAYCASCHGQPNVDYVDFEAYFDGPVINAEDGIRQQIDDLIVCRDCLITAGRVVGIADVADKDDQISVLAAEAEAHRIQLDKTRAYIQKLEEAVAAKPATPQRKVTVKQAA